MLREQLKTIKKELGEDETNEDELDELSKAIDDAEMPDDVETQARKELRRLEACPRRPASTRCCAPTSTGSSSCRGDSSTSRAHRHREGARDPRRRPLRARQDQAAHPRVPRGAQAEPAGARSPILCFVGPPGVGKTSLGQSIARALGPQVRARVARAACTTRPRSAATAAPTSARCRAASCRACARPARATPCSCSTRSTSLGAASTATRRRRCSRCSTRSRTRPSATTTWTCRSTCAACCSSPPRTCSTTCRAPLRDRMEVIELPGYTQEEKLQIAQRYLVPRQLEANGLREDQCELTPEALRAVVGRLHARGRRAPARARDRRACCATPRCRSPRARRRRCAIDAPTTSTRSSGRAKFEHEVAAAQRACRAWPPGSRGRRSAATSCSSRPARVAGQRPADPDRPARRRDEGERPGGAEPGQVARRQPAASSAGCSTQIDVHIHVPAGAIPKDGPERGRRDVHRARLAVDRPHGAQRRRR